MCGAFGTLGVLTELTLRVVPLPPRTMAFALGAASAEAGLRALRQAAVLPVDPTGLAYLPRAVLEAGTAAGAVPLGGAAGVAVIRLEGADEALEEKLAILRQTFAGFETGTVDDAVTAAVFREVGTGGVFVGRATDIWRVCVPSSAAHEAVERSGAHFWYADWAGGLLWLGLNGDEDTAKRLRGDHRVPRRPRDADARERAGARSRCRCSNPNRRLGRH